MMRHVSGTHPVHEAADTGIGMPAARVGTAFRVESRRASRGTPTASTPLDADHWSRNGDRSSARREVQKKASRIVRSAAISIGIHVRGLENVLGTDIPVSVPSRIDTARIDRRPRRRVRPLEQRLREVMDGQLRRRGKVPR
jgi:hypothetical protein